MIQKISKYDKYLIGIFTLYGFHQVFYIFIGGNTYDEMFLLYESGNIYNKIILFFTDNSNELLYKVGVNEYYGFLVVLPIYLLANSNIINSIFIQLFSSSENININNNDEILYILLHIFLNLYVIIILFFIYKKLNIFFEKKVSLLFVLFLLLFPSINGHALFNIKDIPYALQLFLTILYIFDFFLNSDFKNKLNLKKISITGLNIGLVCLLRVNAYGFVGIASLYLLILFLRRGSKLKTLLYNNLLIYFVSIVVVILGSPSSWKNPIKWFIDALEHQFFYTWSGSTITNGRFIDAQNMESTYLVEWLIFKSPIVFLIGFGIFTYQLVIKNITNEFARYSYFFIVFMNLLFFVFRPSAYDGIRQFLFIIPFLIIIFIDSIAHLPINKLLKNFAFAFCAFYLVLTQMGLGAYKYIYFNELIDENNLSYYCEDVDGCGEWPTDYWAFSGKELANFINKNSKSMNIEYILSCKPPQSVNTYLDSSIKGYRNVNQIVDLGVKEFYVTSFQRPRPNNDSCRFDTNDIKYLCNEITTIETSLRNKGVNLSYLHKCSIES